MSFVIIQLINLIFNISSKKHEYNWISKTIGSILNLINTEIPNFNENLLHILNQAYVTKSISSIVYKGVSE